MLLDSNKALLFGAGSLKSHEPIQTVKVSVWQAHLD